MLPVLGFGQQARNIQTNLIMMFNHAGLGSWNPRNTVGAIRVMANDAALVTPEIAAALPGGLSADDVARQIDTNLAQLQFEKMRKGISDPDELRAVAKSTLTDRTAIPNLDDPRVEDATAAAIMGGRGLDPSVWNHLIRRHTTLRDGSFVRSDTGMFLDSFDSLTPYKRGWSEVRNFFKRIVNGMGKYFQFAEDASKTALFMHTFPDYLKKGFRQGLRGIQLESWAARQAGEFTHLTLFDYQAIPPAINAIRGWGIIPFITFPYKAIPSQMLAAMQHPGRFSVWNDTIQFIDGLDDNKEKWDAATPDYMHGAGWLRIGVGPNESIMQDLTFTLPWGDMGEYAGIVMSKRNPEAFAGQMPINIPLMNWVAEIRDGRDSLTGAPLWDWRDWGRGNGSREITHKMIARFYQNIAPPMLFGSGSAADVPRSILKAHPELQASLERSGHGGQILNQMWYPRQEQPTLWMAALSYFAGVKTRPMDINVNLKKRAIALKAQLDDIDQRQTKELRRLGEGADPQMVADMVDELDQRKLQIIESSPLIRYNQWARTIPSEDLALEGIYDPRGSSYRQLPDDLKVLY